MLEGSEALFVLKPLLVGVESPQQMLKHRVGRIFVTC